MDKPFVLCFEIQGLPKILTNARMHWRVRHNENVKWKKAVFMAIVARSKVEGEFVLNRPLPKAKLTLTRFSSSEPDFDGLTSSFKSVLDGLVEAGVIVDDKVSVIGQPTYLWQKAAPKQGKIRVRVESIERGAA